MMAQEIKERKQAVCAWCQFEYDRETGQKTRGLTAEEFEQTRHDGTSHGICQDCGVLMKAQCDGVNFEKPK